MALALEEFYQDFFQDIVSTADADGDYKEDTFFDRFTSQLVDAGDLETADRAAYAPPTGGVRVDGYGGDPADSDGTLSLIVLDFNQSAEIGRLTATEMNAAFKRTSNFLGKCLDPKFRNALEETGAPFGLADLIAKRWAAISKIRLFLLTNKQLSAKVDGRKAEELDGKDVIYSVWDIDRLHRFATAGHGREEIIIDLETDHGGAIPLLPAHQPQAGYTAYLAVVPGAQLAAIYDRWGSRLLEQNVRVFLQARGGVNKGIRNTLDNDPEMFFAYNNGITATAEATVTREADSGLLLTELKNFQIVNGGQTTASVHAAFRRKIDLSKVFVQMKLSIVPPERALEVVPKISEFANSQNKVNAADFFANHPFHVRMEDFSRRIYVPSADGTFRQSKWFYERSRGQFLDSKGMLAIALQKKFDLEYPKEQLFSKTDLAKYWNVWRGHPDIVSKGAQKNFAHFASAVGADWTKQPDSFNEDFYRHSIALAIIFRATEKLVPTQTWYQGGYRANIVSYAMAKIALYAASRNLSIDLNAIWKRQKISTQLHSALEIAAYHAFKILIEPPAGISNVTEWAKQQACWARLVEQELPWPEAWTDELVGRDEISVQKKAAIKDQRMLNGIEAQTMVFNSGGKFWTEVLDWGRSRNLLTPKEIGVLQTASAIPAKLPSEAQSIKTVEALRKLQHEGCILGRDLA